MTRHDARTVECPRCRRATVFGPANRWRPFCSQRCKQIDLGAWASGAYLIEGTPGPGNRDQDEAPAIGDQR